MNMSELDDVLRSGLDREYPDWKDPAGTHMIPSSFPDRPAGKGAAAEEVFYNLIHQFGDANKEPMFVVHSYPFCVYIPGYDDKKKRSFVFGEADFVIIHKKHGVMFFEVKATRTNAAYNKAAKQLEKDRNVLKKYFQGMPKGGISASQAEETFWKCPSFVVMPRCRKGSSDCIRDNVLYQEDCASPDVFSQWWNTKLNSAKYQNVDETIFEYLVMRFVGMTYIGPPLGPCLDQSNKAMMFKTREQVEILAGCFPPRLLITGPAGSGKTYLLLAKAVELAGSIIDDKSDEKVLVLCFNSVLKKALEAQVKRCLNVPSEADLSQTIRFTTFSKLVYELTDGLLPSTNQEKQRAVDLAIRALKRGSPFRAYFDHILVDEGQDLFGRNWPQLLKNMHKSSVNPNVEGGLQKLSYFWVMYDMNQYLYFAREQAEEVNRAFHRNSAGLSTVLRNTQNVFLQSKKYFRSLMPGERFIKLGHEEVGRPIVFDDCLQSRDGKESEGALSIVCWLKQLQEDGVQAKDICILCENQRVRDTLRDALNTEGQKTQTGDDLNESQEQLVVVESIRRFKGLESKVVIVYNPPFTDDTSNNTRALLYTAVSRCSCFLIVMSTKEGIIALRSSKGVSTTLQDPTPME